MKIHDYDYLFDSDMRGIGRGVTIEDVEIWNAREDEQPTTIEDALTEISKVLDSELAERMY